MASDAGTARFQNFRRERLGKKGKTPVGRVSLEVMGSTATVILVMKNDIFIANIGDSKAVAWGNDGKIILETEDHRPERKVEK